MVDSDPRPPRPTPGAPAHSDELSVFSHRGERAIQARYPGVREMVEQTASRVMHPFIPEKQRRFFAEQPLVLVGSVDPAGWPWASVVFGSPGFVATPDDRTLAINAAAVQGDPLGENAAPGAPVSFLGIAFLTRRRNRVNATVRSAGRDGFVTGVDQFFGNCPKYIQTRHAEPALTPSGAGRAIEKHPLRSLDRDTAALIRGCDTFFVASHVNPEHHSGLDGVDINHRGGKPGFVKVEGNTLTVPDYAGNQIFNTLGNFLLNPQAGLLFLDFDSGDLVQLTGTTEILWENHPEVLAFEGAQRAWRFHFRSGHRLKQASPLRWTFGQASPFLKRTGAWDGAEG